jgi:hypothetical protein
MRFCKSQVALTTPAWALRFFSRALSRWLPRAIFSGGFLSFLLMNDGKGKKLGAYESRKTLGLLILVVEHTSR